MTTKLGTDYILDALVAEGLAHLFMVPGGLVDRSCRRSHGRQNSSR
jgi:hypothetical protein